MKHSNSPEDLELLAYADGFLDRDPARKAHVETVIETDPRARTKVQAYQFQNEALRRHYSETMRGPVPDSLYAAVGRERVRYASVVSRIAAVLILMAGAGAIGWETGRRDRASDWIINNFADQISPQFSISQTDSGGEAKPAAVKESVPFRLAVPDLADYGYTIVDKKVLQSRSGPVTRMTYSSPEGRQFSLFLRARWEERETNLRVQQDGDVSVALWLDGPVASALVSKLPAGETKKIAETVRQTMRRQSQMAPADEVPGTVTGPVNRPNPPVAAAPDTKQARPFVSGGVRGVPAPSQAAN